MPVNTPAAIVDVYDPKGDFITRVDFPHTDADDAFASARDYATKVGQIITSGRMVILDGYYVGSTSM